MTNSLAFVYAEDKDSRPTSNLEMETSPIADSGILSSINHSKKYGIWANTKVAEPSFKSEQGFDIKSTEDDEKQDVSSRAKIRALQAVDYVNCVNSFVATNTSKSCAEACIDQGLNCCVGNYVAYNPGQGYGAACGNFTGKVYNNSCNGHSACVRANIPTMKNGCNGISACFRASIPTVKNGCNSYKQPCRGVGYVGFVGEIVDSCNGNDACGSLGSNGRKAGNLIDSCNGGYACLDIKGNHTGLTRSCNSGNACGQGRGAGNMTGACNGDSSCFRMESHGDMNRSCNDFQACYNQGVAGDMADSCNGNRTCFRMESHVDITESCNENRACYKQGIVISDMNYCCNADRACQYANRILYSCSYDYISCDNYCYYGGCKTVISNVSLPSECTGTTVSEYQSGDSCKKEFKFLLNQSSVLFRQASHG